MMRTISARLAAVTFLITLVALGGVTLLWNNALREERRAELSERLVDQARLLASLLPAPDAQGARTRIDTLVRSFHDQVGSRFTVIAADGTVLAESELPPRDVADMENHSRRPEIVEAMAEGMGQTSRRSPTLGIPMAYVAVRWGPAEAPYGTTRAALPMTRVLREQQRGRTRLLLVVAAALGLATALGSLGAWRISRPLTIMSHASRRIADGDLDRRLEPVGSREARELAQSVNHLADSLQAEIAKLEDERRRLDTLLERMPDGILTLDATGRITRANQAAQSMLGMSGPGLGRTPVEAVRSSELQAAVDRTLAAAAPETLEFTLTDPSRRILSVSLVPLASGLVMVVHDMTRLRRLEEARRDLVANIGHELRTPLTAILGYLETLEQGNLDAASTRRFLGITSRNARRLERLVQDLSRLARLESPGAATERKAVPVSLAELVEGAVETVLPRAREKAVSIETDLEPGLPRIPGDASALETVVLNLLDNALRASPESGVIRVEGRRFGDDAVQVSVRDHGPGVPQAFRERIFERFYRMDAGRAADEGGSGLGLAIVKHAVQLHGGRVWVEDPPGGGARFVFILPGVETVSPS